LLKVDAMNAELLGRLGRRECPHHYIPVAECSCLVNPLVQECWQEKPRLAPGPGYNVKSRKKNTPRQRPEASANRSAGESIPSIEELKRLRPFESFKDEELKSWLRGLNKDRPIPELWQDLENAVLERDRYSGLQKQMAQESADERSADSLRPWQAWAEIESEILSGLLRQGIGQGAIDEFCAAVLTRKKEADLLATPTANLIAANARSAGNQQKPLSDREQKILVVIQLGAKGRQYCRELDNAGIQPRRRGVWRDCPRKYQAAHDQGNPWTHRIEDEKSKIKAKAKKLAGVLASEQIYTPHETRIKPA
jgi:hypothetical protein